MTVGTARSPLLGASAELQRLIASLESACGRWRTPRSRAAAAEELLAGALTRRDWLPDTLRATSLEEYRPHLIHVAADRSFSVLTMAWLPGQHTPIHDHIAWGVVGVYEGVERNTGYTLHAGDRQPVLQQKGMEAMLPGSTAVLVPPDEDIHRVECWGTAPAVSLHVYGADVSATSSSINRRFDHLPIADASGLPSIAWRTGRRDDRLPMARS